MLLYKTIPYSSMKGSNAVLTPTAVFLCFLESNGGSNAEWCTGERSTRVRPWPAAAVVKIEHNL